MKEKDLIDKIENTPTTQMTKYKEFKNISDSNDIKKFYYDMIKLSLNKAEMGYELDCSFFL